METKIRISKIKVCSQIKNFNVSYNQKLVLKCNLQNK